MLEAAAAVEAAALHALEAAGGGCQSLYTQGAPAEAGGRLAGLLGCPGDETPRDCIEGGTMGYRLARGCARKLRAMILEESLEGAGGQA